MEVFRTLPVLDKIKCDLLIVGAGPAGVAAAVAAARQGLKVTVLEKNGFSGGGAVAGYSGTFCGIYTASEQCHNPQKIVGGILDEFLHELQTIDGVSGPIRYGNTYTLVHQPDLWKCAGDRMLRRAGVNVLYHAHVDGVFLEDGRINAVRALCTGGYVEFHADQFVDASGDAVLIAQAGLNFKVGDNGSIQNPSMMFRIKGVDTDIFSKVYGPDSIMGTEVVDAITTCHNSGDYYLPRKKIFIFPTGRDGEVLCNCTRAIGDNGRELNVLKPKDHSEAEFSGRRQVLEYLRFFKNHLKGFKNAVLEQMSPEVGVRQTRQIIGVKNLTVDDVVSGRKFSDGIAQCAWPIELHSGEKPRVEWLFDDYYEIPYGCLVPRDTQNVLVAGRCLSTDHLALASSRVTAQCFLYGEAAGLASSIAFKEKVRPEEIRGERIRDLK